MFKNTSCAICETVSNSKLLYNQNLDSDSLTVKVFSARRLPDKRHFAWVRCNKCGLLRSDPIVNLDLHKLYRESTFDYSNEIAGLKKTYIKLLRSAIGKKTLSGSILEVGGGNGFFLEAALESGFSRIAGVEPSIQAVSKAKNYVQSKMIVDIMRDDIFPENSFDIVVMFHVMDHLPNPQETLLSCYKSLKPGGIFITAVHNEKAFSAKILRNNSPIFDVEHTYLYSKKTGKHLLRTCGFHKIKSNSYANLYSILYLIQLLPMNKTIKLGFLNFLKNRKISKLNLLIPLGNIIVFGEKPIAKKY